MTPDTLAFLIARFDEIESRMVKLEDRIIVIESVTTEMRGELDEISEGAFEDGYVDDEEDD